MPITNKVSILRSGGLVHYLPEYRNFFSEMPRLEIKYLFKYWLDEILLLLYSNCPIFFTTFIVK